MKNKLIIIIFFSLAGSVCFSQQLTLSELIRFSKISPEEINNAVENKNWFYKGKKDHEGENFIQFDEPVTRVTWWFNVNNKKDDSRWTHELIYEEWFEFKDGKSRDQKWELSDVEIRRRIILVTYSKIDYDIIKKNIELNYKKTDDRLDKDLMVKAYDGISCWIMAGHGTESPIFYEVEIRNKNGT